VSAPITIRWRPFRLPMRARFETATGSLDDRDGVLVELIDAAGHRGLGEASPLPSLGAGTPDDVLALLERHGSDLLTGLRSGDTAASLGDAPGAAALRCALDVAMLDLEARSRDLPIAALLAEEPAPWVAANAIIGGGPALEVARHGLEALEAGYSVLKVKVGMTSLREDVHRVERLREACPEATIRLDANCAWDEETAREAIALLYPQRIELLEQPVAADDVEALARVRQTASLRIAADEAVQRPETLDRVLTLKAADLLVLKPMLLGGLRPALQIARRAAEQGIGAFVTTTYDSSIGIAASLHLAAALPTDAAHGLGTGEHLAADVVAKTLRPRAGRLALPSEPGLGVTYDDDALDAVATAPWSEAPREVGV
jgi:o-succinylbenzoate synthase